MSVESEILRIQHNISSAYTKVAEKGGEVPLQPNSQNLAQSIATIQSSGELIAGDGLSKDGNTMNVDLPTKSVTKAEYEALTEEQKQAEAVYLVDEPPWMPVPLSIQEYDTDDGWHVRKWSSGYVEMWTTKEYTAPENMIFWEGWRLLVAAVPKNELPVSLTARLNENAFVVAPPSDMNNVEETLYGLLQTDKADLTHTCAYSFLASDNYSSRIITISIAVTGRWK